MDRRTQKRIASVQRIKSKPYYKPIGDEPDPVATCSARHWKWQMHVWVEMLKDLHTCDKGLLPQNEEGAAPDVSIAASR